MPSLFASGGDQPCPHVRSEMVGEGFTPSLFEWAGINPAPTLHDASIRDVIMQDLTPQMMAAHG
jgi:hypothetical protein